LRGEGEDDVHHRHYLEMEESARNSYGRLQLGGDRAPTACREQSTATFPVATVVTDESTDSYALPSWAARSRRRPKIHRVEGGRP